MFNSDIFANRPNFGIPGRIFISTDTLEIYRDTGSSWTLLSGGGGGGGTISGSIAAGQVAFGTAANTIGGSNNLFWDNVNAILGIGTNVPGDAIEINKNQNSRSVVLIKNLNSGNASFAGVVLSSDINSGIFNLFKISSTYTTYKILNAKDAGFYNEATGGDFSFLNDFSTGKMKWAMGASATAQATLFSTGNYVLGSTTDTGQRLQITGQSLFTGDTQTSGFIFIGTSSNRPWFTSVNGISSPSPSGTALQLAIDNPSRNSIGFDFLITSGVRNYTSGSVDVIRLTANFTPTSGNGVFNNFTINPTINQTGANGITRGLYVNPTLTAASDFRAIETTKGSVIFNAGTITGGINLLTISETFAPISGSDTSNLLFINPVINQTGTATGQTRGLWVNPTLTAAADWRSIQWSNNTGWGLFGNGLAPSYISGNLQLGSVTPIGSDINLQVTGKAHIFNFTSYSSGAIQPFVIDKQIAINTNISASTGICNYVSTGDNIFQSSRNVPESTTYANIYAFNKYQFGAAGVTFTATQATPGVRAISQITTQNVFKGANSGTITHMAGIQILGYYNDNTGTITPIIPNAYQLLINDTGGYGHSFTFTNRWGIYQEGINDRNYLAGNLMLNSTTDTGQILQVNGAIRVNGQASGSAGGNSGNHLIINVDGTQYKIALLNP
jgi:hypothetical protein